MSKLLVIAEKPSVAGDIAKALGNCKKYSDHFENDEYVIASARGHLVEMYNPEEETADRKRAKTMVGAKWSLESLPVIPANFALRPIKDAGDRIKQIGKLAVRKDVTTLVNACDAGREGELIFYNLASYLEVKKPVKRLWLQSMTTKAILDGLDSLRSESDTAALCDAAKARARADWLVGINSTRALTAINNKDGGFLLTTVGRVQTPTLAFLVVRHREREAHVSKPYWRIEGQFETENGKYTSRYIDPEFVKDPQAPELRRDRIWQLSKAEVIRDAVIDQTAAVEDVSKLQNQSSPPLFNLSALQREANARLGLSANATLRAAQSLYERKLLTYPRTDSRHLPPDYIDEVKKALTGISKALGDKLPQQLSSLVGKGDIIGRVSSVGKQVFNVAKISDHFAIIPTGELPNQLNRDIDKKIFELVCRRFVGVFMPPAKIQLTTRTSSVKLADGTAIFETNGRVIVEAGWLEAAGQLSESTLPPLAESKQAKLLGAEIESKETQPPPRYTDATLLAQMERADRLVEDAELSDALTEGGGLGTPATRASVIEELIINDYLVRDSRELGVTQKAISLIDILAAMGVDELTKPELTGKWESRLHNVEASTESADVFLADIGKMAKRIISAVKQFDPDDNAGGEFESLEAKCPSCGGQVNDGHRKYACSKCGFFIWKNVASRVLNLTEASTLLKEKRVGPFDDFKSRRGSKFTATLLLQENGKVNFEFEPAETVDPVTLESIGACPLCKSKVLIGERSYLCEKGFGKEPECGFSLRKELLGREISTEEVSMLITEGKTALLENFVSRKRGNRNFSAYLQLTDGKVSFAFEEKKRPAKKVTKKWQAEVKAS